MPDQAIQILERRGRDFGLTFSRPQLERFHDYLDELFAWNRKINLTGLSSVDRIVIELFLDSLIPAPLLPDTGRLLDVGSGAGFPGIPLKIYHPGLQIHLVESRLKRVSFLKQVVRILGLDGIRIVEGRIEDRHESLCPKKYHVVTSRAVARLDRVVAWCAPFLKPGGLLVGYLGAEGMAIGEGQADAAEKEGLVLHQTVPYRLPGMTHERHVVFFQKSAS